ncbi:2786_t:CDS:2, partial [Gigaspora rosea]
VENWKEIFTIQYEAIDDQEKRIEDLELEMKKLQVNLEISRTIPIFTSYITKYPCVEGSSDYLGWETKEGIRKSTNHLEDILQLTENGKHQVRQINNKKERDIQVWKCVSVKRAPVLTLVVEDSSRYGLHLRLEYQTRK